MMYMEYKVKRMHDLCLKAQLCIMPIIGQGILPNFDYLLRAPDKAAVETISIVRTITRWFI